MQAHIGEHILQSRPTAVVVETAITPQHGAMPGNMFSCQGEDLTYARPFARMLCYCASQLKDFSAPAETPLWEVSNTNLNCLGQSYLSASACWPLDACVRHGCCCVTYSIRAGVDDVPMLHTLTGWALPGRALTTN